MEEICRRVYRITKKNDYFDNNHYYWYLLIPINIFIPLTQTLYWLVSLAQYPRPTSGPPARAGSGTAGIDMIIIFLIFGVVHVCCRNLQTRYIIKYYYIIAIINDGLDSVRRYEVGRYLPIILLLLLYCRILPVDRPIWWWKRCSSHAEIP